MKPIVSAAHIATQAYGAKPLGQTGRGVPGRLATGGQATGGAEANSRSTDAVRVEISQEALKAAQAQAARGGSSAARPLFSKTSRDDEVTEVFEPLVISDDGGGRGRREAPLAGQSGGPDSGTDQRPGRLIDIRV